MVSSFLSLPGEIRNKIYEIILVDKDPIDPWRLGFASRSLFRVSETIRHESTSLYFSKNCFDLTSWTHMGIDKIMKRFGTNNLPMLQHVYFPCPILQSTRPERAVLDKAERIFLTRLSESCPNLEIITLSRSRNHFSNDELKRLDNLIVQQILDFLNTHLNTTQASSAIHYIEAETHKPNSDGHTQNKNTKSTPKETGWTICKRPDFPNTENMFVSELIHLTRPRGLRRKSDDRARFGLEADINEVVTGIEGLDLKR